MLILLSRLSGSPTNTMEYTTLHYDLVDIMTSLSPDRMNHLVTTYQQ